METRFYVRTTYNMRPLENLWKYMKAIKSVEKLIELKLQDCRLH